MIEFKVRLIPFPSGGGHYAATPVASHQACCRCNVAAKKVDFDMRLMIFQHDVTGKGFDVEVTCPPCADELVESHAKKREEQDGT